ncbi:MAG: helix-turn-helix transcriptional regulator [Elusimicrobiota bacterium]
MGRPTDAEALVRLKELLKSLPPDVIEQVLKVGRTVPEDWVKLSTAGMVKRLRRRFDMTQRQLGGLSGLPHSKVAKVEKGQDVRMSTLRQLFAGFGCGLLILPVCCLDAEDLWRRTDLMAEKGYVPRHRRYPRK